MSNIKFTSIKPNFVFEHEGVKLKAELTPDTYSCEGCYFNKDICESEYPCSARISPKQIKSLIFKKVENET